MIGVIDYRAGNTRSVLNALKAIDVPCLLTDSPALLADCDGVILPGVGSAKSAVDILNINGLFKWLRETEKPVLGICLGMQLLFDSSEEGNVTTLGIVPGRVRYLGRFEPRSFSRIPHMGWNRVNILRPTRLMDEIPAPPQMYFAHSFAAGMKPGDSPPWAVGETDGFCAAVEKDNFFGVQFHPEKSSRSGLQLLKNFEAICR